MIAFASTNFYWSFLSSFSDGWSRSHWGCLRHWDIYGLLDGNECGKVAIGCISSHLHCLGLPYWLVSWCWIFIFISQPIMSHTVWQTCRVTDLHSKTIDWSWTLGLTPFGRKSVSFMFCCDSHTSVVRGKCILWDIIIVSFYGTFILYHHCISTFIVHCVLFHNQPSCGLVLTISQPFIN